MDREFYVADSFDRCSVDSLCGSVDTALCSSIGSVATAEPISYCTTATGVTAANMSFMDTISETKYKMDDVVSALKELGKRLGVTIDNDGRIVSNQKMNFKFQGQRRLRRCELKTLQGTF